MTKHVIVTVGLALLSSTILGLALVLSGWIADTNAGRTLHPSGPHSTGGALDAEATSPVVTGTPTQTETPGDSVGLASTIADYFHVPLATVEAQHNAGETYDEIFNDYAVTQASWTPTSPLSAELNGTSTRDDATPTPTALSEMTAVAPPFSPHVPTAAPVSSPMPAGLLPSPTHSPDFQVIWSQNEVRLTVAPDRIYVLQVTFTAIRNLSNPSFWTAGPAGEIIEIRPLSIKTLDAGQSVTLTCTVSIPSDPIDNDYDGYLGVKVDGKKLSKPLPLHFHIIDE